MKFRAANGARLAIPRSTLCFFGGDAWSRADFAHWRESAWPLRSTKGRLLGSDMTCRAQHLVSWGVQVAVATMRPSSSYIRVPCAWDRGLKTVGERHAKEGCVEDVFVRFAMSRLESGRDHGEKLRPGTGTTSRRAVIGIQRRWLQGMAQPGHAQMQGQGHALADLRNMVRCTSASIAQT